MHIYEHMNDVLDIMWGNVMEADKYIRTAHELKDECRIYADWCKEMAARHMEFNTGGKAVYDRLKDRMHEDHEHAPHHAGILMILDRNMAKLNGYCAEMRSKIDAYSK